MKEERTGKCLRQVDHIRVHLWHRYSIMVNQVKVATVKFWGDDLILINRNPWFRSFPKFVSSNPLPRKSCQEPQALEYRFNWDIYIYVYTPLQWAPGMLLHINGKFTTEIWNQGIKQTYLYMYLSYPVFQAQWDRYDQRIIKPWII
jgi:hypothetical protein